MLRSLPLEVMISGFFPWLGSLLLIILYIVVVYIFVIGLGTFSL